MKKNGNDHFGKKKTNNNMAAGQISRQANRNSLGAPDRQSGPALRTRKQVVIFVFVAVYAGFRKLSDFIKNILICVPKMNEGLTGL